jgi:hypothetical protein
MTSFGLPKPDYLKIDVDSIEHLILEGFGIHLSEIKSIAIENSKNETVKSDCELILKRNEFECVYEGRANSIWRKTKNAPE